LVLAIRVAKLLLEDAGFAFSAPRLQRDQGEKKKQEEGPINVEEQARKGDRRENINRVADAGVNSGGDEGGGLRTEKELPRLMRVKVSAVKLVVTKTEPTIRHAAEGKFANMIVNAITAAMGTTVTNLALRFMAMQRMVARSAAAAKTTSTV
jgi:hypothetical protein